MSEQGDQKIKFRTCPAGELKFCIWRNSILLPHLASKASRSSSDVMLHTPLFLWSSISRLLACPFPVFLLGPCRARLRTTEFFLVAHSRGVWSLSAGLGSQLWDVAHIDMLSNSLDSVRSCLMSDWPWHALRSHFGCWGDWMLSLY